MVLKHFFEEEAIDEKLRKTFMELVPGNYDTSYHVEWGPITASSDLVDLDKKMIVELKTRDPSSNKFLPKMHNLFQLMYYMTILDYQYDTLLYHIIARKKDEGLWREFIITLSYNDRHELGALIIDLIVGEVWEAVV